MDNTLPVYSTQGCLLQLLLGVTACLHICSGVSASCIPMSFPLSLLLWIPGQSLPDDVLDRLPENVASPTPLSSQDL